MLNAAFCEVRVKRMLDRMSTERWDLFVTANRCTIYRLTGEIVPAEEPVIFALRGNGDRFTLRTESYSIARSIVDPVGDLADLLKEHLVKWTSGFGSWAVEQASIPSRLAAAFDNRLNMHSVPADAVVRELRRSKDEDEIAAIAACLPLHRAAYDAARRVIQPGATELDLYTEVNAVMAQHLGTSFVMKGDFAVGERAIRGGGPPTRRKIQQGDLCPVDLFPAPEMYFADTCRTFCAGAATDEQYSAWEAVLEAKRLAESLVRPGVLVKDVYRAAKELLDAKGVTEGSFWHHLGHGIGGDGHDEPRIIPGSEERFVEGDVITLEPGVYTAALQGGIRIEDNYVVRASGLQNLFDYPTEL
ncbi:M24 family metallopeptidase [Bryobacter aggregatus]|uniref:M24 family metallopeptidase n=1 Tax=Bryobacter aggregatus TaxID=360054 RepID=UPI0004E1E3C1|nr:M24 family metallopeptidase [Bryobacter aggregatus]